MAKRPSKPKKATTRGETVCVEPVKFYDEFTRTEKGKKLMERLARL